MVFCAAFDCNNDSRYTTGISYHCFPRDEALRSQWLAKISRADLVVSKNSRLCSEHFTPDCYERDLKAEILGLKPRSTLKPGAIPTVFSHRRPSKRPRLSSEKRSEEKVRKEYIASVTAQSSCRIEEHAASALEQPTPVDVVNCGASTSTSDSPSYPFPHYLGPKSTLVESQAVQVNFPNKGVDFGIQVNRGLHLMMKSTDTQVEVDVPESSTQTEEITRKKQLKLLLPQKSLQEKMTSAFPQNRKIQMIKTCQDQTTNTKEKQNAKSHRMIPNTLYLNKSYLNCFSTVLSVLSGSTFTKEASLADILNLKIFSAKTFYNIQNKPGSSAHNALKEVVFDKNLLQDIQQLTLSCHTGNLEMYHSVQTKYAPKRQHFSCNGMVARTQLAAIDHNANTGRQQATVSRGANQGELQYQVVFPKNTKEW
ncbi:hypothetical protein pdam_00025733, partial [Pocillopora damicornis]